MENVTLQIHAGYSITIPFWYFCQSLFIFPIISPSLIPSILLLLLLLHAASLLHLFAFSLYSPLFHWIINEKPTFCFPTSSMKNSSFSCTFLPLLAFFRFSLIRLFWRAFLSSPTGFVSIYCHRSFVFFFFFRW